MQTLAGTGVGVGVGVGVLEVLTEEDAGRVLVAKVENDAALMEELAGRVEDARGDGVGELEGVVGRIEEVVGRAEEAGIDGIGELEGVVGRVEAGNAELGDAARDDEAILPGYGLLDDDRGRVGELEETAGFAEDLELEAAAELEGVGARDEAAGVEDTATEEDAALVEAGVDEGEAAAPEELALLEATQLEAAWLEEGATELITGKLGKADDTIFIEGVTGRAELAAAAGLETAGGAKLLAGVS